MLQQRQHEELMEMFETLRARRRRRRLRMMEHHRRVTMAACALMQAELEVAVCEAKADVASPRKKLSDRDFPAITPATGESSASAASPPDARAVLRTAAKELEACVQGLEAAREEQQQAAGPHPSEPRCLERDLSAAFDGALQEYAAASPPPAACWDAGAGCGGSGRKRAREGAQAGGEDRLGEGRPSRMLPALEEDVPGCESSSCC